MGKTPIAKIRLAAGQVGYYDDYSRIYLSTANPEAIIYAGTNMYQIKKSIKSGRLKLVSGSLTSEQTKTKKAQQPKKDEKKVVEQKVEQKSAIVEEVKVEEVVQPEVVAEVTEETPIVAETATVQEEIVEQTEEKTSKKRRRRSKEVVSEEEQQEEVQEETNQLED